MFAHIRGALQFVIRITMLVVPEDGRIIVVGLLCYVFQNYSINWNSVSEIKLIITDTTNDKFKNRNIISPPSKFKNENSI